LLFFIFTFYKRFKDFLKSIYN